MNMPNCSPGTCIKCDNYRARKEIERLSSEVSVAFAAGVTYGINMDKFNNTEECWQDWQKERVSEGHAPDA